MRKNFLSYLLIPIAAFFLVLAPVLVHAEDDEDSRDTKSEDSYDDDHYQVPEPVVTPVEIPVEQSVTQPIEQAQVEEVPVTPAPILEVPTTVEQVQIVNKLVTKTVVPPIIVRDDNQNGIVDSIERLYTK